MMKCFVLLILLFTSPVTAWAGWDEGVAAYEAKDYATALKEWQPLAEQGNAAAQERLGHMYFFELGVKQNFEEAVKWYRKAAEQGDVAAQKGLGDMYSFGLGVEQNFEEVFKWYRKAAEQGDADAQRNIGDMYANGKGVQKNDEEAVKWYRKVAQPYDPTEPGDAIAQRNLGDMYATGRGVQKNEAEAVWWWRKAAERGDMEALGWCTANGWGVEKNIDEAERLLKLEASKGSDWAKEKLRLVQKTKQCLKKSSTAIFGEALNCTSKFYLRRALKNGGLKPMREDDGYWYDKYDSSAVLEGSSELSVAYIEGKFAKAFYQFNSRMDTGKVVDVRNMVFGKYGKPSSSVGDPSVGEVMYTWKLKDGIKVEVSRGWPDTTVYLNYIHPVNFAAMEAEQERQKQAEAAEKHSKQNRAF